MNRKLSDAKPLTHEEAKLLCSLLDRMSSAGRETGPEDLDLMENLVAAGMTDASKRRLTADSSSVDEDFEHLEMPKSKYGGKKSSQSVPAPIVPDLSEVKFPRAFPTWKIGALWCVACPRSRAWVCAIQSWWLIRRLTKSIWNGCWATELAVVVVWRICTST